MTIELQREDFRLMHVDDDPSIRAMVREISVEVFAGACQFAECGDGGEALRLYPSWLPDLVLMDIEMGSMDGLAATRALRAEDPEIRVVMLTNHDSPRFRRAAREAGAWAYLLKDDLKELIGLLESLRDGLDPETPASGAPASSAKTARPSLRKSFPPSTAAPESPDPTTENEDRCRD